VGATLLTDELRVELEQELASGTPITVTAQRLGVARRTLTRWLSNGKVVRRRLAPALTAAEVAARLAISSRDK
jgi:hypothetical protein